MYAITPSNFPTDATPIRLTADSVEIEPQTQRVIFKLGEVIVGGFYNINFYKLPDEA